MHSRLIAAFRADRLLCGLTGAMAAVSVFPILLTPFLPLVDLGSNIGAAGLIDDLIRGVQPVSDHYRINFAPVPYWTGYAIMGVLEALTGAVFAVKATVALVVLLLPLSVMRLLVALGRSPRLGLWAFLFAWDVNLYWGWLSFQLGMALALWAIAWLVEASRTRDFARIIPLIAIIALTHLHAIALVGVVGLALAWSKRQPAHATLRHGLALSGGLILLPWAVPRLGGGGPLYASFSPLTDKASNLFRVSIDTLPSDAGTAFTLAAFLLILFAPGVFAALERAATPERTGPMAITFLAGTLLLYLAVPLSFSGAVVHWYTYPRFATYVLIGLLLLPAPNLAGRKAWLLAPGLVLVVAINAERARQFSAFGTVARPYLEIMEAMRPRSTFLPLDLESSWEGTREWPLGQMHGYAAAARASYDPHLFDEANIPVVFRPEGRLPAPDFRAVARSFSMEAHGRFYDYLITYPRRLDPIVALSPAGVKLVKEAGEWRLYEVLKPALHGP